MPKNGRSARIHARSGSTSPRALQEAVVLGEGGPVHLAVVGQLLDAGADPNLGDRDGHTPLRNAEERNHTAIAERIRRAGGRR